MRSRTRGDAGARVDEAVARLAGGAAIEMIPLRGAAEKLPLLPAGSTVTVTSSPKFGLDRTIELSGRAAAAGFRVVPHLAARQLTDTAELRSFVRRVCALGITDLYVVGGDAAQPAGTYRETTQVLESLAEFDHGITSVGVACYPEGHPLIADETLLDALARKQPFADYMVSQLCFDPDVMTAWLRGVRDSGITLPLQIGLAAPLRTRRLVELSLRIGVGASLRYLRTQHGMVGNLLAGSSYRPEDFLTGMGGALLSDAMRIEAVHLFSFNEIDAAVAWQRRVESGTGRHHERRTS